MMKKIVLNLTAFVIISLGLAFAFYYVQTQDKPINNSVPERALEGSTRSVNTEEASSPATTPLSPAERDPNRLWCNEHGLYEDECLICHPELAQKKNAAQESEAAERDPNRLWCNEHGLYEDECVLCHPELAKNKTESAKPGIPESERDPNRLWCREHNLYEDECILCHPELANKKATPTPAQINSARLWCKEHGLYEDECVICHPELKQNKASAGNGKGELICAEHRVPEAQCGICQPQLAANLKPGESMKVRLASVDAIGKAGIQSAIPTLSTIQSEQAYLCTVTFNQNHSAHISALANGVIQKVHVDLGDEVKAGQVLVELTSTEMSKAKSEYLKAMDQEELKRGTYQREKELVEKNISARQDFQQAEADYQMARTETKAARQQLANLGFSLSEIATLEKQRQSSSVLSVQAPFSGTVIEKHAVLGEAVEPGETILEVVDLSTMWLQLSIPESQMSHIQKGDEVLAEFDALPGQEIRGQITWVSPRINPETRLLSIRAEVPNPNQVLKEGLFGRARLAKIESPTEENWIVPADSIQEMEGKPFVFVKQGEDLYDLRHVAVGNVSNNQAEILAGLQPGDAVVAIGGFTLKSELLKSSFGAGCAHD